VKAPRRGASGTKEAPIHVTALVDSTPVGITEEGHSDAEALISHTTSLPLDREKVEMVITDLGVDAKAIAMLYPKARHQYCVFHIIQAATRNFKKWLKKHRHQNYPEGERKEATQISWAFLTAFERLTNTQKAQINLFLAHHPQVAPYYKAKEMLRRIFAAKTPAEAYAWRDMLIHLMETYPKVAKTFQGTLSLIQNHFERCIAYLQLNQSYKTNNFTEKVMRKLKKIDKIRYHLRTPESRLRHYRFLLL